MPKGIKHSDSIVANVRAQILSCRLQPGIRLRMGELCKKYSVSLGAVREALSRLSAEGLVISESQKGFSVAPVSIEELDDLTRARIDIESLCLAKAIESGDVNWEAEIVSAHHRLKSTPEREEVDGTSLQAAKWAIAHGQFHKALVAGCQSATLLEIRNTLYERSERYRMLAMPLDRIGRDVAGEHDQIVHAVLDRDVKEAQSQIKKHFEATAKIIRESTKIR